MAPPESFDTERFAALVASFTNNPSEAEAINAARMMLREGKKSGLRVIDLFYQPDVLEALDATVGPVRPPMPDVAAIEAQNEELREKLAFVVPKVTELADVVEVVTRERDASLRIGALRVASVLAIALILNGATLVWAIRMRDRRPELPATALQIETPRRVEAPPKVFAKKNPKFVSEDELLEEYIRKKTGKKPKTIPKPESAF